MGTSGVISTASIIAGRSESVTSPSKILAFCVCGKVDCQIPYGLCHCGCKRTTKISHVDDRCHGWVKGRPRLFLVGHCNRIRPLVEDAQPFKIDGVYCRLIPLTKGMHAIVDAADYKWLMQWKWNASWNQTVNGFYAKRGGGGGPTTQMHRVILGLEKGDGKKGDHKNQCTIDNRRKNLRDASNPQNTQNQGRRSDNTSGYKGVDFHQGSGKWRARIVVGGKRESLGLFWTKEEAYAAYCAAAIKYFGEFARLA